ncbi:MAG TPA: glycosyl transferase [Bacteroidales bacterium]|nr:MAG: glycosyl transferase [Bacteroidetes bacterium GWF2_33_38]OFY76672.1 MAG: glycosyl transferase [Bacteroidetes bacterium RIFOXYA12_FULL_33_9]OFY86769.1 MAG: glycosyl transferase [Bacteroidetes bacterium RIFOXYA2_FULL_33_7]HBF88304.1 glycosyl transferase [Bacteroidales bacterium]
MSSKIKFLIIRFSSIGDIVLTSPVVRIIKEQIGNSEVHFLTKTEYSFILSNNPNITKVHSFEKNLTKLIAELKYEHFDYIIDLHNNIRTRIIKNKLQVPSFSFNKLNFKKWMFVNFKQNKLPNIHIVDRYINTLHVFDVTNDNKGLDYYIPKEDEISLPNLDSEYIAFVIGAKHFTKQIPTEKIVEICEKLDFPIVFLGGKSDEVKSKKIIASLREKRSNLNIFDGCGKYNLNQSASIIKNAKVVITPDTGLMHIAAAFHKKIISVWGNTVPDFGMYPYLPNEKSVIVENKNLKCRPCSKIGFSTCPKKHFKCMADLDSTYISDLANKLFKN